MSVQLCSIGSGKEGNFSNHLEKSDIADSTHIHFAEMRTPLYYRCIYGRTDCGYDCGMHNGNDVP